MKSKIVPVILSGGAGARLWPVSREALPKPFIKLPDGRSLLQKTLLRAAGIVGVEAVLTVTNRDYYFLTKDDYAESGVDRLGLGYLLEPAARNTAPAIAAAALHLSKCQGADTILLVLPADHLICDQAGFAAAVDQASLLAEQGWLVTFGVKPTRPETGYGYIEAGETIADTRGCRVSRYVEKPDLETAQAYLVSGRFTWNSGMFCFTAATLLRAMRELAPAVMKSVEAALAEADCRQEMTLLDPKAFAEAPDISLDYAVMEQARNVAVIPVSYDWNDIGSWDALAELNSAVSVATALSGRLLRSTAMIASSRAIRASLLRWA